MVLDCLNFFSFYHIIGFFTFICIGIHYVTDHVSVISLYFNGLLDAIIEDECCISGCVLPHLSSLHVLTQHFLYLGWGNTVAAVVCVYPHESSSLISLNCPVMNFMTQRSGRGFTGLWQFERNGHQTL